MSSSRSSWFGRALLVLAGCGVATLAFWAFIGDHFEVGSSSMEPTLSKGERVFVRFSDAQPRRGDILVFHDADPVRDPLVKRVVGLPGEEVAITSDGDLRIDRAFLDRAQERLPLIALFDSMRSEWSGAWSGLDATHSLSGGALALEPGARLEFRPDWTDGFLSPEGELRDGLLQVHDGGLMIRGLSLGDGALEVELADRGDVHHLRVSHAGSGWQVQVARERRILEEAPQPLLDTLVPGQPADLEFLLLDGSLYLWVDGELLGRWGLNGVTPLPSDSPALQRRVVLGSVGGGLAFGQLQVLRDLHFTARGTFGIDHAVRLEPQQVFVLGDASEQSTDSRVFGPVRLERRIGYVRR